MISAEEASAHLARAEAAGRLSGTAATNIRRWLTEAPFARYRVRLLEDIERGSWPELDDAFYTVLEFGTGGRRGKMYPVGTNVLNERTIAESARGLADYVTAKKGPHTPRSCVVARDTRHHSAEFAELCAGVMAAAGFRVFLFRDYRSTPLLSFAVRHLHCDAGIMITASHNPPSDNGFKCYAANGGQVIHPTIVASSGASRPPPIARSPRSRWRKAWRTDRSCGPAPSSTTPISPPSSASRSATPATCRSCTPPFTAWARPRWPPCFGQRASRASMSSNPMHSRW